MKFIPVSETEIIKSYSERTDVFETLNAFQESGLKCVKITEYTHKNANSCATALRVGIKRFNRYHIKVMVRKDNVYLVNTLLD